MPLHRFKFALTFAIVATISSTVGAQTLFQEIADARQETQVWKAYALNQHLNANNLEVSVQDGKATLSGEVESAANKTLAKVIALSVTGIVAVDNQIVVHTQQTEVDNRAGGGTEQADSDRWISDPRQSALAHTDDTSAPLTALDRGVASRLSDKPSNRAKFASALERPESFPELKNIYPDAFRF